MKGKEIVVLSWDQLCLIQIVLARRVNCLTGKAQMEEVGDEVAVEDTDVTIMGLTVLCQGCLGNLIPALITDLCQGHG